MTEDNAGTRAQATGLWAGRYRLGASLGTGGMAEVVRAEDTRLGRTVAIKILNAELASDRTFRRRFESEARAAAALSHPNVVAVYDVGEADDGRPFIVMELVEGGSLAERLRSGPIARDEAVELLLGILGGLGAAHDAGILHRDIKPGNVLLGRDASAKVADFGIAKALAAADGQADLTLTSQVLGTPRYLAPERAMGAPATVQADLWAVGVVLYEALTGTAPFEGSTPFELVAAAQAGNLSAPPEALGELDAGLIAVATEALEADPGNRFVSAAAMATALAAAGVPPEAGARRSATGASQAPTVSDLTVVGRLGRAGHGESGPDYPATAAGRRSPLWLRDKRWQVAGLVALAAALGTGLAFGGGSGASRGHHPSAVSHSVRTTSTTTTSTTATLPSAASALGNLVRDVAAGEADDAVDQGSAQNISQQAQQAVMDAASGQSAQAANDLQQAAMAIASGLQHGSITQGEGVTLQDDLSALADALGLSAAAAPTTIPPRPGPANHPGHPPGRGPHG